MNFPYLNSHGACSILLYIFSVAFFPCSQCFTTLVVSISSLIYRSARFTVYTYTEVGKKKKITHQPLLVISTEISSHMSQIQSPSENSFYYQGCVFDVEVSVVCERFIWFVCIERVIPL